MWRYFTRYTTSAYLPVLKDLVEAYNHTYHRSIGTQPILVKASNQEKVWQRLYGQVTPTTKPKFKQGDRVLISKTKIQFKKGYLPNWTGEYFTVVKRREGHPPLYLLKDDHGEILEGSFYEPELQKVRVKDIYKVEAILDQRRYRGRKQYLVKWTGYPSSFNTWIDHTQLETYKG